MTLLIALDRTHDGFRNHDTFLDATRATVIPVTLPNFESTNQKPSFIRVNVFFLI